VSVRLLVSDLDRTLVHAARRLPATMRGVVVEIYRDRAITVASPDALAALRELAAGSAFVPATTRSVQQLRRITPIWSMTAGGWAICANGATLLHRGRPDPDWHAIVDRAGRDSAPVAEARAVFEREVGAPDSVDWMPLLRDCDNRFLYATLVLERVPDALEDDANAALGPLGWHATLHGRKLYSLPRHICKGRALEHLRDRTGADEVMAAGDSMLDVELLLAAEHRWCPRDAELVTLGRVPVGTRITSGGHVQAGAEIARAARDWHRRDPAAPAGVPRDAVP
jgi:hydroxymethylpyrimidine pyrophosphatase-like HAD family hydrolase